MMLLHLGYHNFINADKIVTIAVSYTQPAARDIQGARERGALIDCTKGRRTRSVIYTESGHVVLSSVQPECLVERWEAGGR